MKALIYFEAVVFSLQLSAFSLQLSSWYKLLPKMPSIHLGTQEFCIKLNGMQNKSIPVLIVGGGLTGLGAALFLLKHGVKPVLIERRAY
jgi:hypothetical protein